MHSAPLERAVLINALDALWMGILVKKVGWVLDADIRGFFDTIDHGWMLKFLGHRIADRRALRLIRKWLRAGVSQAGTWSRTEVGTPPEGQVRRMFGPYLAGGGDFAAPCERLPARTSGPQLRFGRPGITSSISGSSSGEEDTLPAMSLLSGMRTISSWVSSTATRPSGS